MTNNQFAKSVKGTLMLRLPKPQRRIEAQGGGRIMKWHIRRGRVYKSINGTAKAHLYYWIKQEKAYHFVAGYYGFGKEIEFQGLVFKTAGEAKNYCAVKDAQAVVIEEVREEEKAGR
jgi:hypothetical protein